MVLPSQFRAGFLGRMRHQGREGVHHELPIRTSCPSWLIVFLTVALFAVNLGAQSEVDRTLQIVSGQAITTGDVRRARLLKLVRADSDAQIQTALENRLLMLLDIGSRQPAPPDDEKTAARRAWEAGLGPGVSVAALLTQTGTTDAGLAAWFADDIRIQKYQTQRFSGATDIAAAIDGWVQGLRRRAGLRITR